MSGKLACNDASVAQQWAAEDKGIVYQSGLVLENHLASGMLLPLFTDWLGEEAPLYAVVPSRRHVPARVQAVIDRLVAYFA